MTLTNKTKQIIFCECCKCVCRLNPIACSNKQKWNKNKCRCECLINKKCGSKFWNPNSCKCEYKLAHLTEECKEMIDNKTLLIKNKTISIKNKTNVSTKSNSIDSCKPFVALSLSFLLVSSTLTELFIYFYVNFWPKKDLPF